MPENVGRVVPRSKGASEKNSELSTGYVLCARVTQERPWWAKVLRSLRKAEGLSQMVLAKKAGVSLATVKKMEMGRHVPRLDVYERVLKALGNELEVVRDE